MSEGHVYSQDVDGCFEETIGTGGLSKGAYEAELTKTKDGIAALRRAHDDGSLPLLRLPARTDDLESVRTIATAIRQRADRVVVLGTGGSSLGGQSLYALLDAGFGPVGDGHSNGPTLHFLDNVDPVAFEHLLTTGDLSRTDFIVISKSGGTAETLTQFGICFEALTGVLGHGEAAHRFTVVTEPKDNVLRGIAEKHGMTILDHDPGVGGRYSVLSNVGMLPAAVAGLDIGAIRAGAASVLDRTLAATDDPEKAAPAVGAAINIGLWRERGVGTSVLMPYLDRLAWFAMWYRQLWAESLGKDGKGTLPVRAVGTIDQHSQLQLYLAGPADKMISFVFAEVAGTGRSVSAEFAADERLAYLAGRTMGDLLDAEQRATAETVVRNGRPTRIFRIKALDERSIGALMMHYMLETIIAAHLLDVDPFDQPAVEEGKILTREYLGRMGR